MTDSSPDKDRARNPSSGDATARWMAIGMACLIVGAALALLIATILS